MNSRHNKTALEQYSVNDYRTPDGYTADIAVFTIVPIEQKPFSPPIMDLQMMLIQRSMQNSEGKPNIEADKWAIAGGFIDESETSYMAAHRELEEETGVKDLHIEHFGVYDKPGRDPRGWIISNAFFAIVPHHKLSNRKAGDDASDVRMFSVKDVLSLDLAFDHKQIIQDSIAVISQKLLQTTTAKEFLPAEFTYSELQAVLATVTNDPVIMSNPSFIRKMKQLPFIEAIEGKTVTRTSKRKAQLYRFKEVPINYSIYHMS
ncbi:MAG TPA: NUDIX hydrolase [Candidatus Paenibacillus intestinavium]|nr:NUDIX hydrolase [Candidatus Paenibacillus intestinavium]